VAVTLRLVAAAAGVLLFVLALELLKHGAGGVGPVLHAAGVSGLAGGIGVGWLQVIVGREVSAVLYGYLSDVLVLVPVAPPPTPDAALGVAKLKSIALSFPVLEWTPFRTFATQLVFAAVVQLGFGVEIPFTSQVVYPTGYGNVTPGASWNVFLRGQFDGRYFFGSREDLQAPR
jgi:hypothetical protein